MIARSFPLFIGATLAAVPEQVSDSQAEIVDSM